MSSSSKGFFIFYEILGLKLQKRRKSIPGPIQKLIFLYSVNLVEFIMEIKIGYPKLKMMWIKLLKEKNRILNSNFETLKKWLSIFEIRIQLNKNIFEFLVDLFYFKTKF